MTEQPPGPPEHPPGQGEFSDFFHTDELPTGPAPPRSHRGERDLGPLSRRVLAPLTAVVVVVVVILLLIWINGKSPGTGPGPGVIAGPPGSPRPHHHTTTPHHHLTPTPTRTPTAAHKASPSATPSISPTARTSSTPTASTIPGAAGGRNAMAPVQVLNNSTISGLAARVAGELEGKGWHVSSVGNFQGLVPVTTVYFAPGQRAAADHLEREFDSIRRVLPGGSGGVHPPGHGLTLVVTRDWSG